MFRTTTRTHMPYSDTIVALAFFAAAFGIAYIAINARHRQRMAMIDKGFDAALHSWTGLKLGYLGVGAGAGLGLGWFADTVIHGGEGTDNPSAYFIGLLVCGGLSLIMAHQRIAQERRKAAADRTRAGN